MCDQISSENPGRVIELSQWATEEEAFEEWERRISTLQETNIPGVKIDAAGEMLYSAAWL